MPKVTDLQSALDQIVPKDNDHITLGQYSFREYQNEDLLLSVLEKFTRKHPELPTYQQFLNYYDEALRLPKPRAPDKNDPRNEDPVLKKMYAAESPLKYPFYLACKHKKNVEKYLVDREAFEQENTFLQSVRQHYKKDTKGYIRYLFDLFASDKKYKKCRDFFTEKQHFSLNEKGRERHSYITGGSGSGKTELMKLMIHYYLTEYKNTSLVILEPEGDLALQVAQFKENVDSDRIVYIDPLLDPDFTPVINPFVLPEGLNEYAIDRVAQEIYAIFQEILKGSDFSEQMETLLMPCITTLLLMGGQDIRDLQRFMDNAQNGVYIDFALNHLFNESQINFFKYEFNRDSYNPTKQSIKTKIQNLLNSYAFSRVMTGEQSFDLETLLTQNKIVIYNLNEGEMGQTSSDVIGRFIVSQLKAIALKRSKLDKRDRPKTHVFIDECQRFVTDSIAIMLTRARKYRMHLTLANQYYGQGMSQDFKKALSSNTWVKMSGSNDTDNLMFFHKATEARLDELKTLDLGEFHVKERKIPSIKIKVPSHLIDNENAMKPEQWNALKKNQLERYYRPVDKVTQKNESHPLPQQNTHSAVPEKPTSTTTGIQLKYEIED